MVTLSATENYELQEMNDNQKANLFRILEESDVRSLRSIPIHLFNLNFLYESRKILFDKKLSPLLLACFIGKVEIIQILFTNEKLDINIQSYNEGYTPLMVALYKGYYEICRFLLDRNADVDMITNSGHYPILFCFSRLEDDKYKYENRTLCMLMIDLLLSKGADLNIRVDNNPGYNVLMKLVSIEFENEDDVSSTLLIVKFLIERGADKNMSTLQGETLFDTIKSEKYRNEIMRVVNTTERKIFYETNKEKEKKKLEDLRKISSNSVVESNYRNSTVKNIKNNDDSLVLLDKETYDNRCCKIF